MAQGWIQGFIPVYTSKEVGCAEEGLWSIVGTTTQGTHIAEALPLERLTKSGRRAQRIVLILKQQIKQSAGAGTAHTQMLPTHPKSLVSVSHSQSKQPLTMEPHPMQRWRTCLANSHITADCPLITPFPENNSKQIRHSICLGQLPQTVKSSNKKSLGSLARCEGSSSPGAFLYTSKATLTDPWHVNCEVFNCLHYPSYFIFNISMLL